MLARRHDNGGDFWASADGRLLVGSPFSTLEALQILHELGLGSEHEAVSGALDQVLSLWREDGRIRIAPKGAMYPCHTANAARVLCRFGLAEDPRVRRSLDYLQETPHEDGGWRCNRVPLGRAAETDASNPGVTLFALDAFRFEKHEGRQTTIDKAVETLLSHWTIRRPLGPCEFGIGSLFMQVEYPFLRYNIFSYVYVLSFYKAAREDGRFRAAFDLLQSKLDESGRMVVERPNRKLAGLEAFAAGQPSQPATHRFNEILANLG